MNFQDFCRGIDSVDGSLKQGVEVNLSGEVIRFVQLKTNKEFLISSKDIFSFLGYVCENDIESAIRSDPRFTNEKYTQYEEKGYRALFSHIKDIDGLRPVSSLGGSQSLGVTQIISKLICFAAGIAYKGIKNDTNFDKISIKSALNNIGHDIQKFLVKSKKNNTAKNLKDNFTKWLSEHPKGWSDSTVKKYSNDSINKADEIIGKISPGSLAIYKTHDPKFIMEYISLLEGDDEWLERNNKGNSMFSRGVSLYKNFLEDEIKTNLFEGHTTTLSKSFILLAGISGTGKTRFVRQQAKNSAKKFGLQENENLCLVPVRPDWHEPSDLLGYISRLDGTSYVATDFLEFTVKALCSAIEYVDKNKITWKSAPEIAPYWLCLDEMNLAPVEQYFADYLSILETREWNGNNYKSHALLSKSVFESLVTKDEKDAPLQALLSDLLSKLELSEEFEKQLSEYFINNGIPLPPNLIVAGTVNMDETTHGFSRKVLDRALTFDFGQFFPNDFDEYFEAKTQPNLLTFPTLSQVTQDDLNDVIADNNGSRSIYFLKQVNDILKRTPFELAYRALNELLLSVKCASPKTDEELQAVWDDFLMCKVLPRIEGDEDKLSDINGSQDNILKSLLVLLEGDTADKPSMFSGIWQGNSRPDLLREKADGSESDFIPCRSKDKLEWMVERLEKNTFTSFWP
ncbi:MAG: hypothetical protein RPR97_12115 [Colwellia sp.]